MPRQRPPPGRVPNAIAATISASAISAAGSSPAMNSPPIDRFATKPSRMRLMHGGIVSAITADAASRATALPGFWPWRRAAGIITVPTAATSAIFEPEMPENSTMLSTITTSSPPRSRPTIRSSSAISRAAMPLASISAPVSRKNGMASRTKLSMPRAICCAKITPGTLPSRQMKISAVSASTKPIGMPAASASAKPHSISRPTLGRYSSANRCNSTSAATIASATATSRGGKCSTRPSANSAMHVLPAAIG